jgi:putative transposase
MTCGPIVSPMPRVARIVLPGCPHHITQRGNNRQDIFFVDDDKQVYLQILARQAERYGLVLHAYALMTNHVHLIATPKQESSLAKTLGRAHYFYTTYINRFHGRVGHLWQNRFFSCAMDEVHIWSAFSYVELNPVRAGLSAVAWEYPWSSAATHCGKTPPEPFLDIELWRSLSQGRDWRQVLTLPHDTKAIEEIRRCTMSGRPLAGDSFLSKLEVSLGRRIRPLPVGRPRRVN